MCSHCFVRACHSIRHYENSKMDPCLVFLIAEDHNPETIRFGYYEK